MGSIFSLDEEEIALPKVLQAENEEGDADNNPMAVSPENPVTQEDVDHPVLRQPTSSLWSLKRITLDGSDVAVTLFEWESFIQELPFLECVLPSMQAGEPYFVPVFILKILLPWWEEGRGQFSEYEQAILSLSRDQMFPAVSGYLELLSLAALLEHPQSLDAADNVLWGVRAAQLMVLIRGFFGVSPFDDFLRTLQTVEELRLRLLDHLQSIPALLMIGRQWRFDATKIAANLKELGCVEPLLDAIIEGMQLPDLPKTVPVIAWTMCPDFTCSVDPNTDRQTMLMKLRFASARGRPGSIALPSPSLRSILRALESKRCPAVRVPSKKRGTMVRDGKRRQRRKASEMNDGPSRAVEETLKIKSLSSPHSSQAIYVSSSSGSHIYNCVLPGFDFVAPEGLYNPGRSSPPRSDDLFHSSPQAHSQWPFEKLFDGKNELHENDKFSAMLEEDPLGLFDNIYGFDTDLYADELDSDLFAGDFHA